MRREQIKQVFGAFIALFIALVYSLCESWHDMFSPEWESPWLMLFLGGIMVYDLYCKFGISPGGRQYPNGVIDSAYAWGLLCLFFVVAVIKIDLSTSWRFAWCLWLFLVSGVCFTSGRRNALLTSAPLMVFVIIMPLQKSFFLLMSHPLRLIATMLSANFLKLFGVSVTYNMTMLSLSDINLAITDACSGIQQFEALLLLGYLLVRTYKFSLSLSVLHYAFVLPSVIIANAIRLIVVVILYYTFVGDKVLRSGWHEGLGYFQVILAVALLWGVGKAIQYLCHEDVPSEKCKAKRGGSK